MDRPTSRTTDPDAFDPHGTARDHRVRAIVLRLLTGLAALLLLSNCGTDNNSPAGPDQWDFQQTIAHERESLFPAAVHTRAPGRVPVGDSFSLGLRICGPASSCAGPGTPSSLPPAGTVQAGALMRVWLDTRGNGEIIGRPSEIQPVVQPSDAADWVWRIRADKPGRHVFDIHIQPLLRDTQLPLLPEIVTTTTIQVDDTLGRRLGAAWSATIDLADGVGGMVGAVAAMTGAAAGLWRWRHRLRRIVKRLASPRRRPRSHPPTRPADKPED
jgi:hypothetical protein